MESHEILRLKDIENEIKILDSLTEESINFVGLMARKYGVLNSEMASFYWAEEVSPQECNFIKLPLGAKKVFIRDFVLTLLQIHLSK